MQATHPSPRRSAARSGAVSLVLAAILCTACASGQPHLGYRLHSETVGYPQTALLVHVPQAFRVIIVAIDGRAVRPVVKTSKSKPTYIEVLPGDHTLFVKLGSERGPLRECIGGLRSSGTAVVELHAEPGRGYLLQRKGDIGAMDLCSRQSKTFHLQFWAEELPPATWAPIRETFTPVRLEELPWYPLGESPRHDRVIETYRASSPATSG